MCLRAWKESLKSSKALNIRILQPKEKSACFPTILITALLKITPRSTRLENNTVKHRQNKRRRATQFQRQQSQQWKQKSMKTPAWQEWKICFNKMPRVQIQKTTISSKFPITLKQCGTKSFLITKHGWMRRVKIVHRKESNPQSSKKKI